MSHTQIAESTWVCGCVFTRVIHHTRDRRICVTRHTSDARMLAFCVKKAHTFPSLLRLLVVSEINAGMSGISVSKGLAFEQGIPSVGVAGTLFTLEDCKDGGPFCCCCCCLLIYSAVLAS